MCVTNARKALTEIIDEDSTEANQQPPSHLQQEILAPDETNRLRNRKQDAILSPSITTLKNYYIKKSHYMK